VKNVKGPATLGREKKLQNLKKTSLYKICFIKTAENLFAQKEVIKNKVIK
jgi:hypothetical protein